MKWYEINITLRNDEEHRFAMPADNLDLSLKDYLIPATEIIYFYGRSKGVQTIVVIRRDAIESIIAQHIPSWDKEDK